MTNKAIAEVTGITERTIYNYLSSTDLGDAVKAVRQAAAYASEKTGMQVTVGYVRLAFPLDLRLEQVQALQPNDSLPQVRDTVLMARSVVANVALWPLFDKQVDVRELALHDVTLNTVHFIRQARVQGHFDRLVVRTRSIDLARQNVVVNAALLKGAKVDVALNDTAKEDTTKSQNFWKIKVHNLRILQSDVLVHMPGDSMRVGVQLGEGVLVVALPESVSTGSSKRFITCARRISRKSASGSSSSQRCASPASSACASALRCAPAPSSSVCRKKAEAGRLASITCWKAAIPAFSTSESGASPAGMNMKRHSCCLSC